jgi:hypothetical protein
MDVSMPGRSGEVWYNPDIAADAWQKTINTAFAPDEVTLELNEDGEMSIKADVQELIDGAAQQEQMNTALALKAPLASPVFTGTPTAPTASAGTNSTQLATTEFVKAALHADGISPFTYLVDSNAALAAWANNTAGNDYTSVLIAPGTWTSSVEVNLTAAGTKVVAGMPGSKLAFTSQYGLRYTTSPTGNDYRMEGVTVEVNLTAASYAFYQCTNLTNCTGTASSSASHAYTFYKCDNMTNCIGTAHTSVNSTASIAFYSCNKLTNCAGTATAHSGNVSVFGNCTRLTNCTASATTTYEGGNSHGFDHCSYLTNCTATSTATTETARGFYACGSLANCVAVMESSNACAFDTCSNLTSCTGQITVNGNSGTDGNVAFYQCTNLTNCSGTGVTTTASLAAFWLCNNLTNCSGRATATTTGYAFSECKGMLFNSPYSASKTGTYYQCYVSPSGTGNAPANTAAGGWNLS